MVVMRRIRGVRVVDVSWRCELCWGWGRVGDLLGLLLGWEEWLEHGHGPDYNI